MKTRSKIRSAVVFSTILCVILFCSHCHHTFEKEPGYFFGSMFVSYALIVGKMIVFLLIAYPFIESFVTILVLMGIATILGSTYNFRLSRMIWMYLLDGPNKKV